MIRRDVTRAEVEAYLAMFEHARRRHGLLIAIETIITAERFRTGKAPAASQPPALDPQTEEASRIIVAKVAAVYGVTVEAMGDGTKSVAVVAARREACWRLRQIGLVIDHVARLVGVAHSVAHNGVRAFEAALKRDRMLRRRVGLAHKVRSLKTAGARRAVG